MDWNRAEKLLKSEILVTGKSLDTTGKNKYKIVTEVPNYYCRNYSEIGFRVQVGKSSFINIPMSMLEKVFKASMDKGYERSIFQNYYPQECSNKPCYVHAIGLLFTQAGIMNQVNNRLFEIVEI